MGLRQGSAVAAALCVALVGSGAAAETKRIAIVAGNNAGAGDLAPLRFAENDAGKMARVLVELGDVSTEDVLLLQGRRVSDLEKAISDARERVAFYKRTPDMRTVLLFYFSGHSDGESIEMGQEMLAYGRLKALLTGTGADVRVSIVDACRSGAGLREKGGRPAEAFSIRLADTLQATGDAFITSSAADESALESSEVGGSYFTHNLISGLRGAADASGDKLVTLAEAYQYAYDRTVSATAGLSAGVQHPNYDFRLSGQGELVLSSLLRPSSTLVLPEGAERALVTDLRRDQVVVEVGISGARDIALSSGQYGLRLFKGGQGYGGRVVLAEGDRRIVSWSELTPTGSSVLVARKGSGAEVRQTLDAMEDSAPIGLSLGFGGTARLVPIIFDANNALSPKWQLRLALEPLGHRIGSFNLFGRPRLGAATVRGDLTLLALGEMSFGETSATAPNEAGAQLRVGYRISMEWWRLMLGVGVEAGPGFIAPLTARPLLSGVLVGAPHATIRLRLAGPVSLTLDGDVAIIGAQYRESETAPAELRWYAFPSASAGLVVFF